MGGPPTPDQLLEVAVTAVRAAGAVLVEGLRRPRQVTLKGERASIVTEVDVAAQRAIADVIAGRFPHHGLLAEEDHPEAAVSAEPRPHAGGGGVGQESQQSTGDEPVTWLVDPLDGTSNYAHGIPFACTSVAARDATGVAAGAVLDPFRGELFTASRGGGAWLGDQPLAVSGTGALPEALVCTGLQSDDDGAITAFGRRIVALSRSCRGVRCVGSPALCLAYVATGRIDAFLERDATFAWDVGAGALLIAEAGGRIEDLDGGPVNLGPGLANVLASNGRIQSALAEVVQMAERTEPTE